MTDNEIIKALELEATPMERNCVHARYEEACGMWCSKKRKWAENCMECKEHAFGYYGRCAKATLDLINRQKAEIERLNKIAIVPPCKIDDPVFFLGKYTGQIVQAYVTGIQKTQHDMFIFVDSGCFFSVNQQLGKSVFLTKEEAQKALEKENQK